MTTKCGHTLPLFALFGHIFGGKNAMELEVSRHTLPLSALSGKNACCLGPWLANRK